ncbi:MAG: tetratricopeptide repeat protein [Bacteroidia bacterium]|nr:tetratricopeptide repeat protein [Bacteroidia bacterium]
MGKIKKQIYTGISVLACLYLLASTFVYCNNPSSKTDELVYKNHHDTVKYVGIQTCRACHGDIYNSFIQTGMGMSFGEADMQKSAAKFGNHKPVYDKSNNMYYYPFWKSDSMYIMEYRLLNRDTIYKRVEKVDYIIGSGQHTNSHLMNINGYVYQMPLTWYAQKQKWDLPPGFENGENVRFSRAIGVECMSCHNAMPKHDENSFNRFENIPLGIDCERCHGPGELHVQEKASGIIVDTATGIDYSIVNPANLSWDLQIDVCQRCHLQGNAVLKPNKKFTDFRPGQRLSDYIDIFMPKYKNRDDEFIMASHAQRLQMSNCFIKTASTNKGNVTASKSLTCISCHNPHVSVKVTGTQIFNNSCNGCHSIQKKNYCTTTTAAITKANQNCVGCHMPKSGTIDIPHVTVTDHWIRKPLTKRKVNEIKEFAGIYCINNKTTDEEIKGIAFTNYVEKFKGEISGLDSAEVLLSAAGTQNTEALVHVWFVKQNYQKIVQLAAKLKPEEQQQAWLCYRIGRAASLLKNRSMAYRWYQRAITLAPRHLDFLNSFGTLCIEMEYTTEAKQAYETSLKYNPKQAEPYVGLGFLLAERYKFEEAIVWYNKALALDPDYEQALFNKAAAYFQLNKKKEAKLILQQLLKKNPKNEVVKTLLNSVSF